MTNSNTLNVGDYVRCYGDKRCAQLIGEVVSIARVNIKVRSYYNPGGLQAPIEQIHKVARTDIQEVRHV
jgi:hypothetical protein